MAKGKKKKKKKTAGGDAKTAAAVPAPGEPLGPAVAAFAAGDYVEARHKLREKLDSGTLNDADRRRAEDLIESTKLDRGTMLTAAGCFLVFVLAVVVGIAVQP